MHKNGDKRRTYGSYSVYIDGQPTGLDGFMAESPGPGDDSVPNNGKRIEAGRYPVWTQFGRYRSIGFSKSTTVAGDPPMPAVLLLGTNRRTGILIHPAHPPKPYLSSVGCLNPTNAVGPAENINFWDSRQRTIDILASLKAYDEQAFSDETTTRVRNAFVVVDGEPTENLARPLTAPLSAINAEPVSLPISANAARRCAKWMVEKFGGKLAVAVSGKAYGVKHLCAIACQETAYKWLAWTATMSAQQIVERCVFDASGDYPGTDRSAFPVNTAAFREKYGAQFTNMLIEEANKTRRLQNYGDKQWVYKGYGIFQYDLQHVIEDEAFFRDKLWYSFDECLRRVTKELDAKLDITNGDLWAAIKAYNGRGVRATRYMENVKVFTQYCDEVTG
jgi:hypothetical protein